MKEGRKEGRAYFASPAFSPNGVGFTLRVPSPCAGATAMLSQQTVSKLAASSQLRVEHEVEVYP